jgi:hypothetical protein
VLLFGLHAWAYRAFDVDDAFIAFRFVRQWVGGNGLVYNIGERVEGYSSFLWVLQLAAFELAGLDLLLAAKLLGVGFALVTIVVTARLAVAFEMPFIAPLLLAASGPFAAWAVGGLETILFAALVTLVGLALVHEQEDGRGCWSGLLLGLLALARPEGVLFVIVAVVFRVWNLRERGGSWDSMDALRALAFLSLVFPYLLWRLWYYGDVLPNTVYAKSMGLHLRGPLEGLYYAYQSVREIGGFLFVALPIGLALTYAWDSLIVRFCLLGVVAYGGALIMGGGDFMPMQRLLVHVLPLVYLLIHAGIVQLQRLWPPRLAYGAAIALIAGQAGFLVATSLAHRVVDRTGDSALASDDALLARYVAAQVQPGDIVAVMDAGRIADALPLEIRIVDMVGLTDVHVARRAPRFPNGLFGRGDGFGKWDVDYVLSLKPRFVQVHLLQSEAPGAWLTNFTGTTLLLNDPRFETAYRPVAQPGLAGLFERARPR